MAASSVERTLDDFDHSRTVLTDGPLLDFWLDGDLRFEIGPPKRGYAAERVWIWHDKWD